MIVSHHNSNVSSCTNSGGSTLPAPQPNAEQRGRDAAWSTAFLIPPGPHTKTSICFDVENCCCTRVSSAAMSGLP